ncbi:HpcH/HpaI aldolase family protein [Pseudosulfitobacter koreensis]|uniref:HpcH/HpaI aldolase/citrate lyase family protein n=1 Tax=Pseudosulfitobacter koreensis TaxID=2968472 RepID=A0ABT1Z159_9RHOB|nr:HpcH/HpaI aldolase/citrate lyase family protein [Pseudosulfitobacter koreense]MCR8826821.1 HpcH/HpaI aldolase/citrate lyase family protein [Pseudosulfitobacter koreense]
MPALINTFKQSLANGETVFGAWLSLGTVNTTELMGAMGFDWLLIDGEHTPYDITVIRDQLMALEASPSQAAVRVPVGETWMIKQVLDAGAQTVLVPMVESADQARQLVRAMKYPPFGIRGVGYSSTRAAGFGKIADYGQTADDQTCLLVQVENRAGLAALDEILTIDGVDGVFIGPADLSADLGHMGQLSHPVVMEAILDATRRIAASGKAPGILSSDEAVLNAAIDAGARFVAVGVDAAMLANTARAVASKWIK